MKDLQGMGGIAALIQALAYIVGFCVLATLLNAGDTEGWSTAQKLDFVLERKHWFQAWMLFIYVVFGIALVVLAVALHERLKEDKPGLMQVATPFGLIWAGLVIASGMIASVGLESVSALHASDVEQATSLWLAVNAIQLGLGGGVEIVGGLWVLLISIAALRSNNFSRVLNYLGVLVGVAGLLTIAPPLAEFGMVFGLGQILWFMGIGFFLLRRPAADNAFKPTPLRGAD
ncbi:DUF4386 family protein [Pseudoxanthomonas sp. PXM02]|uniref:DUF4386 family protein n=1 Tax=Pseudoxanthomonas sp. PXM02 TaxID=2769294 RepID=UPI001781CDE2|nr:DUF4386 family protein [Pseudoxanthomonas sp. PXM02]MBD9479090.1 DUF4386 family protein [Pseudoxanthomonas sp. PXM02]